MFSGKNLLVPLCGNGQRWQAELHLRQPVVVACRCPFQTSTNDFLGFDIEIVADEFANLFMEELRQNLGSAIVGLLADFRLRVDLQEPVADDLSLDLNRAR